MKGPERLFNLTDGGAPMSEQTRETSPRDILIENNVHHLLSLMLIYKQTAECTINKETAFVQIDALCDTIALFNEIQIWKYEREKLKRPILQFEGLDKPATLAHELVHILCGKFETGELSPESVKEIKLSIDSTRSVPFTG